MKEFRWDLLKEERLKRTRGVSFDEILQARPIAIRQHPRRSDQQLMLFERRGYIWVVPFVERGDVLFLKTLYPSRKYTKRYRRGGV
ncbi:MAG: hypothetical protein A3C53_05875 [Omnitrophica WOR_2 bacterium RIFCSPHIGHO2_02_FULL_68_15]|nr:MAG: hypothetical protein A3C53_05875 [Omnitrophica WOR_2 bacterium RIFCSPHIGHO2_02_FULL_68_15]